MCSEASNPSASTSLPVIRVQSRMSWVVGVCRPFSSFDTLDAGQDNDSANCLPLSPADERSSRSRLPSARRASWTLDTPDSLLGGKVVPSYCLVPGSITPVIRLYDLVRVLDNLAAEEAVIVIEVHTHQLG